MGKEDKAATSRKSENLVKDLLFAVSFFREKGILSSASGRAMVDLFPEEKSDKKLPLAKCHGDVTNRVRPCY